MELSQEGSSLEFSGKSEFPRFPRLVPVQGAAEGQAQARFPWETQERPRVVFSALPGAGILPRRSHSHGHRPGRRISDQEVRDMPARPPQLKV